MGNLALHGAWIAAWVFVGFAALYFSAILAVALGAMRDIEVLEKLPTPVLERWPRLSVITPARDEADVLEQGLRSKLQTDYPDLELVVVDDRSRDATGAIADKLAAEDRRVRAVHLHELPAGWLGKLHALSKGEEAASGDWLLFTDADVHFSPDALRRTVGYAEQHGLDFLAVFPELLPSGFLVDVCISALMRALCLGVRKRAIEDPKSNAAVGGGVFNLVRRSAFARTAGFEALKMEVIDDIALGQMVKRAGGRCSVANAHGLVKLYFYRSFREFVRMTEKNSYAAMGRFDLWRALPVLAFFFTVECMPFIALALGGSLRVAGCALLVLELAGALALGLWMRRPLLSSLAVPLGVLLTSYATLRSVAVVTWRGGIRWRETFYSLKELRRGRVLKFF